LMQVGTATREPEHERNLNTNREPRTEKREQY
jgi:hypothetical protein